MSEATENVFKETIYAQMNVGDWICVNVNCRLKNVGDGTTCNACGSSRADYYNDISYNTISYPETNYGMSYITPAHTPKISVPSYKVNNVNEAYYNGTFSHQNIQQTNLPPVVKDNNAVVYQGKPHRNFKPNPNKKPYNVISTNYQFFRNR